MSKYSHFGHGGARVGPGDAKKSAQNDSEKGHGDAGKKPDPVPENAGKGEEIPIPGAADAGGPEAPGQETRSEPDIRPEEQKAADSGGGLADMEARLAELNDQFLRKAADFENFRKRTMREKQEITDFANQSLILDLLPVIDDFERAIKSAQTSLAGQASLAGQDSKDFASFYEGIMMIEKRLITVLENKWGLKRFNSEGEIFDPNRHEAIQMEKSADVHEAVVKEDYLKGYLLKDRVIRFAKVKVLMPEEDNPGPGEQGDKTKQEDAAQ